uniref:Uncharacterized protein n=1 Tax=Knipowitschia caucasica TaxID=637954 RepID=A0AAV2KM28_KNICA
MEGNSQKVMDVCNSDNLWGQQLSLSLPKHNQRQESVHREDGGGQGQRTQLQRQEKCLCGSDFSSGFIPVSSAQLERPSVTLLCLGVHAGRREVVQEEGVVS